MKFGNRQRGMGIGGWMLLILIFGGTLSVSLKLVPVYMDHNTMVNILTKLADEDGVGNMRNAALRDEIKRRFRLNNIREFNIEDNIDFDRGPNGTTLLMVYDVRVPLIKNLTLVADFDERFRLRN